MASWGPGLYQDDTAQDVKDTFKDQLHRGKETEEITRELLESWGEALDDPEDGPAIWFALADTQWNLGRLLPDVKDKALEWIDSGISQKRWAEEEPKQAAKRTQILLDLREKLLSEMPPEKKISQYRLYRCEWEIGDVFAYQFKSDYAREVGVYDKYLYFVKIDESTWWPGHTIPVVHFYQEISINLLSADDLREKAYLPQSGYPELYEMNPKKTIIYRVNLLNTSKRIIPHKQLTKIGNIPNIQLVQDENQRVLSMAWKRLEKDEVDIAIRWKLDWFK